MAFYDHQVSSRRSRRSFLFAFATIAFAACATTAEPEPDASRRSDSAVGDAGRVRAEFDGGIDGGAPDARALEDSAVPDEGSRHVGYARDVRPLLEESACNDCHGSVGVTMDYAWIAAPGETWCQGDDYERRWNCFEEHARTQVQTQETCESAFYHRHGEPCFEEATRQQVLRWAADGYRP